MDNSANRKNGFDQSDCTHSPGEEVAKSGLYEICHYDEPRATAILTINEVFACCRKCGEKVRYKLVRAVPHISEDPDFHEITAPAKDDVLIPPMTQRQVFPVQLGCDHGFRFWQDPQTGGDCSEAGDL